MERQSERGREGKEAPDLRYHVDLLRLHTAVCESLEVEGGGDPYLIVASVALPHCH